MSSKDDREDFYSLSCETIDGKENNLGRYRGNVLLVVNTASRCHLNQQLKDLQKLYKRMKPFGLEILAFPCSQFMNQEAHTVYQIDNCYKNKYKVNFQLFRKIKVNGRNTHPIFQFLKREAPGVLSSTSIKWNFTKFLISHDGKEIKRFSPNSRIDSMLDDVVKLLEKKMQADKTYIKENGITSKRDFRIELIDNAIAPQKAAG